MYKQQTDRVDAARFIKARTSLISIEDENVDARPPSKKIERSVKNQIEKKLGDGHLLEGPCWKLPAVEHCTIENARIPQ